jgi:hypothetical protein
MAKFTVPFTKETLSEAEARDIAVNYIRACESAAGREIDPDLAPGIGGRIHIATIKPKGSAEWMPGFDPDSALELSPA